MEIGKVPENVLKRSVLRQIRTKRREVLNGAGIGGDCAVFSFNEDEVTVSRMQEGVLTLPGDIEGGAVWGLTVSMAELIQKCANNLAAAGAYPVAVMIALLLPEGITEPEIRTLMSEAEDKCAELNLEIAGGQTNVSKAVLRPVATVMGFGRAVKGECHTVKAAAPGQDIVVSKWIGLRGTSLTARYYRETLLQRYPAYLVEEAARFDGMLSVLPEAEAALRAGVCAMHDASEGGIMGALWELAEGAGTGLIADMRKLPLRQETVEVCECCGMNPYTLEAGGCLVMTSPDGAGLAAALHAEGIPAVVVGKLTEGKDRILTNADEIRWLNRPERDSALQRQGGPVRGTDLSRAGGLSDTE